MSPRGCICSGPGLKDFCGSELPAAGEASEAGTNLRAVCLMPLCPQFLAQGLAQGLLYE